MRAAQKESFPLRAAIAWVVWRTVQRSVYTLTKTMVA